MWRGIIQHYRQFLPIPESCPVVTLHEGRTPLVRSEGLSRLTGLEVFLKFEGSNPTGSFKDRGMTLAVSKALSSGARAILCASTGNTSASAAAYGAKAGLPCFVLLPEGAVALGKLTQTMICNARIVPIRGNFDDALNLARDIGSLPGITLVNSVNPDRIEGQKTAAFEICDDLEGEGPDFHLIPVGNAGNITATWKGYREYHAASRSRRLPKMLGFQAQGAAPIVRNRVVRAPRTVASAIRIGNPASWKSALAARDESEGLIDSVTDREILSAYRHLASKEGFFAEPASAASVAGLLKLHRRGYFRKRQEKRPMIAVCTLTGTGLKDPDRAVQLVRRPKAVRPDRKTVLKIMGLG